MDQPDNGRPRAESYAGDGPAQFAEMVLQARRTVAQRGVFEMVHAHRHGEECNGGCLRVDPQR